jgi:signal transduction histidine kinase
VRTLSAKLILLLVVVIVSVDCVLTGVLFFLLRPEGAHHVQPIANQVMTLARIAKDAPAVLPLAAEPAAGTVQIEITESLRHALLSRGADLDVLVTRPTASSPQTVSVHLANGWIVSSIPDLPAPEGAWRGVAIWLSSITVAALAIAVFAARRIVEPLGLLERAIEAVGPDGLLPELPVQGPAEVRVTARALNALSSRLKAAMESRMRLVAAAGHDMRTPITRMRLRAEFVANADDRAMWLKDIDELDCIADSAILLVREETDNSPVESVQLGDLVETLVDELHSLGYAIELTETAAATVTASPLALSRALRNLMINAATHGSVARVRVARFEERVTIVIEDDGPGIPTELLGHVFEPFFRVDPARRQDVPGAGLGLTIAREIIRRARGDISIANGDWLGLRQVVELPIVPCASVGHSSDLEFVGGLSRSRQRSSSSSLPPREDC